MKSGLTCPLLSRRPLPALRGPGPRGAVLPLVAGLAASVLRAHRHTAHVALAGVNSTRRAVRPTDRPHVRARQQRPAQGQHGLSTVARDRRGRLPVPAYPSGPTDSDCGLLRRRITYRPEHRQRARPDLDKSGPHGAGGGPAPPLRRAQGDAGRPLSCAPGVRPASPRKTLAIFADRAYCPHQIEQKPDELSLITGVEDY